MIGPRSLVYLAREVHNFGAMKIKARRDEIIPAAANLRGVEREGPAGAAGRTKPASARIARTQFCKMDLVPDSWP
jgi:hypothetical protein